MARPSKAGLDYFPLDVEMDDKIELIEAKHGIVGFGVVLKLFQNIYKNGFYFIASEDRLLLFSKRISVDNNLINDIINDCVKWDIFDSELFEKFLVLTSRGIQKRYIEATKRRKEVEFASQFLLIDDPELSYPEKVNVIINPINVCNNSKKDDINSQSKVKESKVKNIPPYSPPKNQTSKKDQFKKYMQEKISGTSFEQYESILSDFIDYRMSLSGNGKLKTTKGIDGLLKATGDILRSGLDPVKCLKQTMEEEWLKPKPEYFLKNTKRYGKLNGRSEQNAQACYDFCNEDE